MSGRGAALWRTRVCGLLEQDGRVLLARDGDDSFWTLPGGSVEEGEFSDAALAREIAEELGLHIIAGPLRLVCENLFAWRGQRYQEIVLLLEARLPLRETLPETEFAGREDHLVFRWVARADLDELDIRPGPVAEFLREAPSTNPAICHRRLREADF